MIPKGKDIRKTIVNMVSKGNAAHIGSALSMVEILNSIFSIVNIAKIKSKKNDRDRIILSKGHAASGLYAAMFHYGLISDNEINSYFQDGSLMSGHASHFIRNIEHSTGALGHGLPVALGMAIGCKSLNYDNKVYVIVGDGDLNEGSNWEAIMYAGHRKIDNLYVLIDNNNRAQMGITSKACTVEPLKQKFDAFNFNTFVVNDGHNEEMIRKLLLKKNISQKPTAIICNTIKGKDISFMEGNNLWHYKTPKGDEYEKAIKELDELKK